MKDAKILCRFVKSPLAKKEGFHWLALLDSRPTTTYKSMKSLRIFIADDHALVRRGMRGLLESQPGWTVVGEAASGLEATRAAPQVKPDICIIDYSMPEMTGLEASEVLLEKLPNLKILMLSMHDSEKIVEKALAVGVYGYILKSDAERDVVDAVRALSENKPFFTSSAGAYVLRRMRGGTGAKATSGPDLSLRERQIVKLVAEGRSNKQIAASLHLSVRTVETHRANITQKLGFSSVSELIRYAIRNHLAEP